MLKYHSLAELNDLCLKKDKEMLIEANGNLLQQVPFGKEEPKTTVDDEPKKFDFKSVFDKNGFKR